MFALLALIAFVVAIVKYGSITGWPFWMLLGLAFLALSLVLDALGWNRFSISRTPPS